MPAKHAAQELIPKWRFWEEERYGDQVVRAQCVACGSSHILKIHGVEAVEIRDIRVWSEVVAAHLKERHMCWAEPIAAEPVKPTPAEPEAVPTLANLILDIKNDDA